jgi:hypothetical protein
MRGRTVGESPGALSREASWMEGTSHAAKIWKRGISSMCLYPSDRCGSEGNGGLRESQGAGLEARNINQEPQGDVPSM